MGSNLWDTLSSKVRGGPMSLGLCVIGILSLLIGLILSYEDLMSSYVGIQSLESVFGVVAVSADWVRYVMALAPQIGQIVFISLWSLDTSRRWALVAGVAWFLLDFISDVQFRSGGAFLPGTGGIELGTTTLVSAGMTVIYFTVGAEMFIVAGAAIAVSLFPDAVRQAGILRASTKRAINESRQEWNRAGRDTGSGRNTGQSRSTPRRDVPTGQPLRQQPRPPSQGNAAPPIAFTALQEALDAIESE